MFKSIVKMFDKGNVCVCGLRGDGKDMLMSNVACRRKLPYISNVDYGGGKFADGGFFIPLNFVDISCGFNTYKDFISGEPHYYKFPYPDGTDVYLSDLGVYFPSQYCNELNRDYKFIPVYMALSRHLAAGNVHFNVQNLNRAWDKIREQSDQYILCRWCHVFFGKIVFQKVRIYELYDSCLRRIPPFRLSRPFLGGVRVDSWRQEKERYEQNYGVVKEKLLIYFNKSSYDTRIFKTILEGGKKIEKDHSVSSRSNRLG